MSEIKDTNFMGVRKVAAALSIFLLVASIASLAFQGLKLGLDFTGGTLIEVEYEEKADLSAIRKTLEGAGYTDVIVQNFGSETDILLRMSEAYRANLGDEVLANITRQQRRKSRASPCRVCWCASGRRAA